MSTLADFYADVERKALDQERVNALAETFVEVSVAASMSLVRELARREHAGYAQYDGYFDGPEWRLAKATVKHEGKGGVQFEIGDYFIVKRDAADLGWTAYSVRRGWNCAISYGFREVGR